MPKPSCTFLDARHPRMGVFLAGQEFRGKSMKFTKTMIVCAMALMSLFATSTAQAATVSSNGTNYNLTTDLINYSSNVALLQSQAWWGDAALAEELALASANVLSTQNSGYQYGGSNYGAFFAYKNYPNGGNLFTAIAVYNFTTGLVEIDDTSFQSTRAFLSSATRVLAIEDLSAVPLPAALPLLLAGFGGLGLMRRARKS